MQFAAPHREAMRAGLDIDAGVLVLQAVAGVQHEQVLDQHVRRSHAYRVSREAAAQLRAAGAAQRQRLLDTQVFAVMPGGEDHHITGRGAINRRLDGLARRHAPLGSARGAHDEQTPDGDDHERLAHRGAA